MDVEPTVPGPENETDFLPQPTGFKAMLLYQPAKVFFWLGAAAVIVLGVGLRLERRIGSNFSDQSELERAIRMAAGVFVMMAPYFLFYALIYWLLNRFNRPSSPRLNALHIALEVLSKGGFLVFSAFNEFRKAGTSRPSLSTTEMFEVIFSVIMLLSLITFLVNIVAALMKKRIDW